MAVDDPRAIGARLRDAGCVFAEDEAQLLIEAASDAQQLDVLVTRRAGGEPLQYVLGWAEFCGLRIKVGPGVFIPRPRSEFLAAAGIAIAREIASPVVLDLCCGAGALGAAVEAQAPRSKVIACDIDPLAVFCARTNLTGSVYDGDLYEALPDQWRGRIDLIVANAPYVPTAEIALMPGEARDHEPQSSLDGGSDGLEIQRRVIRGASEWLTEGGRLAIETSAGQAGETAELFAGSGFKAESSSSDEDYATVVVGTLTSAS